ncbi:hypothetical protein [Rothia nasimurium]|uniref:hypothetical protein n=1 Tax=Rothia nasimurium TaxID=85336 RepID=UPI001F3F923A|nr:hypothetical protein [Rothia nasimurium]
MAVFEEVTGRFIAPDGSPLSGSVVFTPAFSFARDAEAVTLPAPVTVQLDTEGRVTASLQVPDESTQPTTWTWQACPRLRHAGGAVGLEPFIFELVAGHPVNLAEVLPVPDPVTGEFVTRGETGADGVGLAAITTEGGELIFTLTDGSESRIPAPQGVPGTGVAGISLEGDELVFALTDGSETRLPAPVGADGQDGDDGQDGVGISTITLEDGELVIALTDGAVTRLPAPKGDPGKDGTSPPAPTLRVEQVQTLPPGSTATAHIGGEAPDYTLTLGVPQGEAGQKGDSVAGPPGPKGEPGNPSALVLVGVGRPDTPSTLSPENQTAVASAPVGATFTSTDGAGTGAWAWVKTPGGWQVTYADTGWRDITATAVSTETAQPGGAILVHRTGQVVTIQLKRLAPPRHRWRPGGRD